MKNIFEFMAETLSPKSVALRYLGSPEKQNNNRLWYKSPLRALERTASFMVSDKGFYDFGTSKFYNSVSFTANYFSVRPIEAVKILAKDFNINIEKNTLTDKELKEIYKQRLKEKEHISLVNNFYDSFYILAIDELSKVQEKLETMNTLYFKYVDIYKSGQIGDDLFPQFEKDFTKIVEDTFYIAQYKDNLIFLNFILDDVTNSKIFADRERLFNINTRIQKDKTSIETFLQEFIEEIKKDEYFLKYEYEGKENFINQKPKDKFKNINCIKKEEYLNQTMEPTNSNEEERED